MGDIDGKHLSDAWEIHFAAPNSRLPNREDVGNTEPLPTFTTGELPKIWVPQNGLFVMEDPLNTDDLGYPPISGNLHTVHAGLLTMHDFQTGVNSMP